MHGGLDCSVWLQGNRGNHHCLTPTKLWIIISPNKLIIFAGSQPHTTPSVFVMKNGTNVACLVKEFYPKDIRINLESSKKITEFDPAIVISPSGKYNAVKLGKYEDSNSVTCSVQHDKKTVHSTDFDVKTDSTGRPFLASRSWRLWGTRIGWKGS